MEPHEGTPVFVGSGARRFVVDTDGLTSDLLYVVLGGGKTLQELRGPASRRMAAVTAAVAAAALQRGAAG
jgi:hypothetical protein